MKYLVYGDDVLSRQKKLEEIKNNFEKKNFEIVFFDDTSFDEEVFLQDVLGSNLFGKKRAFILSYCLSNADVKKVFVDHADALIKNETPVVFVEGTFLKKDIPSFVKKFEIFEYKKTTKNTKSSFNTFGLVDMIVTKNKKKSWLMYQEAIKENIAAEEIVNLLFWQYKQILLAKGASSASELSMKPFVFNKSKKTSSQYSESELKSKLLNLIKLFEKGRYEKDAEERLEQFILS